MEEKATLLEDDNTPFDTSCTKSIGRCMKTLNEEGKKTGSGNSYAAHLLRKSSTSGVFSPYWVVLDPTSGLMTCHNSQEVVF